MDYNYPDVGAVMQNDACRFTVWAPLKKNVGLLLNEKELLPLAKDEGGYWSATIPGVQAGDLYRYQLDDDAVFPDPASRSQPQGVHGPSAVVETAFPWTDNEWKGLPLENMIIYELHTGTFTPEGNFQGVISRLPYLQQLGINAIELMPVAAFPGERNWGYDGVYPFAVQESYGGIYGLKQLVDAAHAHGIAIILDVVYNHHGPEGNYFGQFGPYYTDKYKTPWGGAINFDDAYCDGVRNFYWQNALMWLDEFHVDGLRLDAVHAIWDFSAHHFLQELSARAAALEKRTGRKKILIAEFDLNNPRYITPIQRGGLGMHGQWMDEFHHALHAMVTGEVNGYYEDFGQPAHLVKALRDSYVYTGQYSIHRKKHFGALPKDNPYSQFVVFAQNHDQIGNRLTGDRLTTQVSFECLKVVAATVLLSPHIPLLFMGEEYGETNPFGYFVSHSDEELIRMIRKGRKEEFSYFNWEGEVPDPVSDETFRQCILSWMHDRDEQAANLLTYYRELIHFRKTHSAMRQFERNNTSVLHHADAEMLIGMIRQSAVSKLLILLHFGKERACFSPPGNYSLRKIFDSSDTSWKGPGAITPDHAAGDQPVPMNAESAVIFELQ